MSKRDDIMKIWQESFADTKEYVAMYFDRVYRDDEALVLADPQGATVSSLLLQRYAMSFHGSQVPVSYLCGAATRRQHRGKGYMSALMQQALEASASRGDMLCTLIPARSALYYFYERFGFSTVFYTREQRFTSLHPFAPDGDDCVEMPSAAPDDVWHAFDTLQRLRKCYVLHSRRDMDNIRADLDADGGDWVVMARDDEDTGPQIVSMAWGVPRDGSLLQVNDVMALDDGARTAALHALRRRYPGMPFLLLGHPDSEAGGRLMPRAMARVTNARLLLETVARASDAWEARIRVTDPLLPAINSHTYLIGRGHADIDDTWAGDLDLDVSVDVLADIAFSSPRIGRVMRFPSVRPMISLMLD